MQKSVHLLYILYIYYFHVFKKVDVKKEEEVCGRAEMHAPLAVTKQEMLHVAVATQARIHVVVEIHTCPSLPLEMTLGARKVRLSETIIGFSVG